MSDARATTEWIAAGEIDLDGRFGVFVKYLYARAWVDGTLTDYHRRVYEEHIRVFNSFLEMDDAGIPVKIGVSQFLTAFESVLASIARHGFDEQHAIRFSPEGMPVDGEHRIAACMALDQRVCIRHVTRSFRPPWGYRFFRDRGLDPEYMDGGMAAMLRRCSGMRAAVIFGSALAHKDRIIKQIGKAGRIHYDKVVQLSLTGQVNLVRIVYSGEEWLGSAESGYLGARVKSEPCFPPGAPSAVCVAFLQPSVSPAELVDVKQRVRSELGMGNHSLHITDTCEEARRIGDAVLSANGLHLLNNKCYRRFAGFDRDLAALARILDEGQVDREHVAVVGSGVLSIYGLRDGRDLDVVIAPDQIATAEQNGLEASNFHWESHGFDVHELLYDPRNHFRFESIKFLGLESLIKLKTARGEDKDSVDLSLIELMIDRESPFRARLARMALLLRLYSNVTWLRSYFSHWLIRIRHGTRCMRSRP